MGTEAAGFGVILRSWNRGIDLSGIAWGKSVSVHINSRATRPDRKIFPGGLRNSLTFSENLRQDRKGRQENIKLRKEFLATVNGRKEKGRQAGGLLGSFPLRYGLGYGIN